MNEEISRTVKVYYAKDDEDYMNKFILVKFTTQYSRTAISYTFPEMKMWQHRIFLSNLDSAVEEYEKEKL